jgi:hypothetical protein
MNIRLPLKTAAALAAILMLTSCSDAPPKPAAAAEAIQQPAKPAEPGPAKQAYWKMYRPILEWSKDAQLLTMTNKEVPEMNGSGGKEAAWEVVFVSASKRQARKVVYSEIDSGSDIHKGATMFSTMVWGGPTREYAPFPNSEFGVDSNAAFQTASAKASAWLKAHPNEKLHMLLAKAAHYSTPVWVLNWGDKKSGYVAVVNATSGELISPK